MIAFIRKIKIKKIIVFCLAFIIGSIAVVRIINIQNVFYAKSRGRVDDEKVSGDLLTYMSSLEQIQNNGFRMQPGEDGVYTMTNDSDEDTQLSVLQLTDIHISGIEENYSKDLKAINAVYDLVERTRPDFIVITGDAIFGMPYSSEQDDHTALTYFLKLMDTIGIPWTWTFGNHDHSFFDRYSSDEIADMLAQSSTLCMYPDDETLSGYSNGVFKLCNKDGSISQLLITIDSNSAVYADEDESDVDDYQYIYDDQVEWYEDQIARFSEENNGLVSSMLFFHIPLQEYVEAWDAYDRGEYGVYCYFGEKREETCCSSERSSIFEKVLELGSTKAMFCGHDHYNDYAINYKGIDLVYGKSIDYTAYTDIEYRTEQRGATLINIKEDGKYELSSLNLEWK